MTILEALKQFNVRVSYGGRWLVRNDDGEFVVYSHTYGAKKVRTLVTTTNEDEAVAVLTDTAEEQA